MMTATAAVVLSFNCSPWKETRGNGEPLIEGRGCPPRHGRALRAILHGHPRSGSPSARRAAFALLAIVGGTFPLTLIVPTVELVAATLRRVVRL
jgi:hypothetical protein